MPKKKKLTPKITKHTNKNFSPVYKFEYGKIEPSTLIQFKDKYEESSFYETLDLCVEQKESTDGVEELFKPEGKDLKVGEKVTKQFDIIYTGFVKETLDDLPDVHAIKEFIDFSLNDSLKPSEREKNKATLSAIASHLFELNKHLVNEKLYGKMLFLFTAICSVCSRYDYYQDSMDSRRKIIPKKIETINNLFEYGLVTGKSWSSAPFWNAVRSDLMVEYDTTSDTTTLSPFTGIFVHLNNIIKIDELYRESLFNSVLHILDTFEIISQAYDKQSRRRQITDKFRNLPEHISGPGVEIYTNQQKI